MVIPWNYVLSISHISKEDFFASMRKTSNILTAGVRGLMLAALLASLMSTLTSVFNSASSIVTLDLWAQIRKGAKQAELMIVGRVTVLIMIGISILWLPILQAQQGGLLWFYIAAINAYLSVPLCMVFLLGMFWKGASEPVSQISFK